MPNFHLYFDNETFAKFSEVASKDYHENINQVEWVSVDNGYILPAKKTQNSAYAGGVTDQNKLFVPLSKYERVGGGSLTEAYDFDEKNVVSKDIDVLYAGMIINHFGHFLVEGTSRLWYYIENKDKKMDIAFLMPKNQKIFPQFWEFMALLGIEKKHVHFIKKITRFRKIYVPMQSHVFTSTYNEKFLTFFKGMRDQVLSASSNLKNKEKVYLSRRKFKTGTLCLGEKEIEKVFKQNGYKIVYPEKLTLKNQIKCMGNAKEIVGVSGTGMHMALFAEKGTKITVLERSDVPVSEQFLIDEALGSESWYIGVNQNPFPVDHSIGPVLLGITENLARYFDDRKFSYNLKNVNKITKADAKTFVKQWLRLYTQNNNNQCLSRQNSLLARRLLFMADAFIPLVKKLKQKGKQLKTKLYPYLKSSK